MGDQYRRDAMALQASQRLPRKDFRAVSEHGKTARSSFLFMRWICNTKGTNRFAFVVSLKVSRKAVIRNKIRRLLAECAKRYAASANTTRDMIVVVGPAAATASMTHIRDVFAQLTGLANSPG